MNSSALVVLLALTASAIAEQAAVCNASKCKLPNCQCPQTVPPISGKIPQLVAVSFDDSIVAINYENYYQKLLSKRFNPDGCPIGATFFVPHEYTDYSLVNALYNNGFQIGSHSITKNYSSEYWANATRSLIKDEMGGQKEIISKFANMPIKNITGSRIPQFQLHGDDTYFGLRDASFLYDSSWPTFPWQRYFPYTLDYESQQPCIVGECPKSSIPGFWIVPIINWETDSGFQCNNLLGCGINGSATQIFNWMKTNFLKSYDGNRAPFTVLVNSAWFQFTDNSFDALKLFLDYLTSLKDVFLVSEDQVVQWAMHPVTADKYNSCRQKPVKTDCLKTTCKLINSCGEERYMTSCAGSCPNRYPWLGNTNGN